VFGQGDPAASIVDLRFVTTSFVIEEATLLLYSLDVDTEVRLRVATGAGLTVPDPGTAAQTREEFVARLPGFPVSENVARVGVSQPGLLTGNLYGLSIRRFSDGRVYQIRNCEFVHEVTSDELARREVTVDLSEYRQVIIQVGDSDVRHVPGAVISILPVGGDGTMEIVADDNGQASLLLQGGAYAAKTVGSRRVQFQISMQEVDPHVVHLTATTPETP
jgi:hypothetical protein